MASLLFPFLLFLVSAHGRVLHKNHNSENVDSFANNTKVKAVSLATDDSYTGKTNYNDGLAALCIQYSWLLENNDDPCLPPRWSWIECNSDAKPRILALNLNSKILFGLLPDFSSMDALQRIDLSQNVLSGPIPSFLGTFADLQELNLEYNMFSGLIPDSLACNKNLTLSVTGNSQLYTSGSCSTSNIPTANRDSNSNTNGSSFRSPAPKKKNNTPVILGTTFSAFALIGIAVGIFAIFRHKAKTAAAIEQASSPGLNNVNGNIPTEERPINSRSNDMSP